MEGNLKVKAPKQWTKADCYRMVQEISRARDKVCQHPLCNHPVDCGHHIFKRDRTATAFLPEAVVGVCTQHHTGWAHAQPKAFKEFMIIRLGEDRYYELRRLSYTTVQHPDYQAIGELLQKVLRAYTFGA